MRKIIFFIILSLVTPIPVLASEDECFYYDTWSESSHYWNIPNEQIQYLQAFDPRDFYSDYYYFLYIQHIGIWTSGRYTHTSGTGLCDIYLLLLPDKEANPTGIAHYYELNNQALSWPAYGDHLNTFNVNLELYEGQCVGLGIVGHAPFIADNVLVMDDGPSDTADWIFNGDEWLDVEENYGYNCDFCFKLIIDFNPWEEINNTSIGKLKAICKHLMNQINLYGEMEHKNFMITFHFKKKRLIKSYK